MLMTIGKNIKIIKNEHGAKDIARFNDKNKQIKRNSSLERMSHPRLFSKSFWTGKTLSHF